MAYNPNAIWKSPKREPSASTPVAPESSSPEHREEVFKLPPRKPVNGKILVWFLGALCVALAGGVAFYLLRQPPPPLLAVSIAAPDEIDIGAPATVSVTIVNSSTQSVAGADLSIALPDGISVIGQASGTDSFEQNIGALAPGATQSLNLQIIPTANVGAIAHIVAVVAYASSKNPKMQYAARGETDSVIGNSVISLSMNAPQAGILGVPIFITLNFTNTSHDAIPDAHISLGAPPAFVMQSSSVPMTNGFWEVGPLAPGAEGSVTVQGIVVASSSATYAFTGMADVGISGERYSAGAQVANIALAEPPLSILVEADASTSYIAHTGDDISYTLTYRNNASVSFQGVQIRAKLTGAMFDFSRLITEGAFSSVDDTITWTPGTLPALSNIAPGASDNVQFTVSTKASFPVKVPSDTDYVLGVTGSISSPTVAPGLAATSTSFSENLSTKVAGSIAVDAEGWHYDAQAGFKNAGPYPPIVNEPTQYTIHWTIVNQANDAQNVQVEAMLPAGIAFTGDVTSTVSSTPQYNPLTGLITWDIPLVPANAGIIAPPVQSIFQIEDTPATTDIGKNVILLQSTALQATDAFTGLSVQDTSPPITSDIPNDTGVTVQARSVLGQ